MIPQSFIEDLHNRVDVVDVVGRYVKLKKGGANFVGLCPFHNEKSPSFSVSPTKQFYHCFGCGAHGTAIGFLMEFSGLSFPEAVEELAQGLGLQVPVERRQEVQVDRIATQAPSVQLVGILAEAMDYYRRQLRSSSRAIDYLKGRGLSGEIAARFGLGYAPAGWQALDSAFPDYQAPGLLEAGLVIEREAEGSAEGDALTATAPASRRYDRFRDRIMFPIRNPKGQVIGFGGRVLVDDPHKREPKYLNSPETPVFQKGQELYGLFEARREIREAGFVLVVEGYMDVVALAQLGVPNAVATLGTACTPMHVQKLLRQTDRVVFSFDGDAAGQRAARRALEAALPHATDNRAFAFLFLPEEHDPDSYIRSLGRDAFESEVRTALPLSAFLLRELTAPHDLESAEGRAHAMFDAAPLLRAMPAGSLRMQIVRELARLTDSSQDELIALCELTEPKAVRRGAVPRARVARRAPAPLELRAMRLLLLHPRLFASLREEEVRTLEASGHGAMLALLGACRSAGEQASFAALSDMLAQGGDGEFFATLRREAFNDIELDEDALLAELRATLVAMRRKQVQEEKSRLVDGGLADERQMARYRELMAEEARLRQGD